MDTLKELKDYIDQIMDSPENWYMEVELNEIYEATEEEVRGGSSEAYEVKLADEAIGALFMEQSKYL